MIEKIVDLKATYWSTESSRWMVEKSGGTGAEADIRLQYSVRQQTGCV
jgi:hypothetical protein